MFNTEQYSAPSKTWAVAALTMSVLSVALIIIGRVLNAGRSGSGYAAGQAIQHSTTIIIAAFTLVSLTGLVLSIVALVKAVRNPQIYSGTGIAVVALVLNGIFSLISAGSLLFILILLAQYFSGK